MYTESPYVTKKEVIWILNTFGIKLNDVDFTYICKIISLHNKNVFEDIRRILKSINNTISFKHEELINEIVKEIENDANLELDE